MPHVVLVASLDVNYVRNWCVFFGSPTSIRGLQSSYKEYCSSSRSELAVLASPSVQLSKATSIDRMIPASSHSGLDDDVKEYHHLRHLQDVVLKYRVRHINRRASKIMAF